MAEAWRQRIVSAHGLSPDDELLIGIVAPGVWRRRARLRQLLGPGVRFRFGSVAGAHAVAGWGLKGSGKDLAAKRGLPYLALEDAFIARLGPDERMFGLLGLIADPVGIYYDAHAPSLVEELIAASQDAPETDEDRDLLAAIRQDAIGKFNSLDPEALAQANEATDHYDAIVVDQIAGDLSIPGALAEAHDFERMLEAALDEHPGGRVAVKLHPYDGVGGRRGHLAQLAEKHGLSALPKRAPWLRYVQNTEHVYVVSSNAGLEALIGGAKVTCFGVPFFGGWGLTDDRQAIERRKAKPSLAQLCRAVYGAYGHYWLPGVERQGSALELCRFISAAQRHATTFGGGIAMHGVQKLKRSHIEPFVASVGQPLSVHPALTPQPNTDHRKAVWVSRILKDQEAERAWRREDCLYAEDGFLRSVGLGADLVRPSSLIFDSRGIYLDPSKPSDLECALQEAELSEDQLRRGRQLTKLLGDTGVSKYNVGNSAPVFDPGGRNVVLVPGQVENDASILRGAGEVRTNRDLLLAVREARPDAFLVYKPHPDVELAGRPGFVPHAEDLADLVLTETNPSAAISIADEVHTMTSLMGFEALLRGKHVSTYGLPFYAGWGLTQDRLRSERRGRQRTLEELVYLTLVHYPFYVSPRKGTPATPEMVIEELARGKLQPPSIPGGRAALRLWRKLSTAPDYLR
ncbi:capsular polysaccharide biosynthesis protein [Parvularcula lutaonensis]|uniref:Capsular polysaccharide biosynthesis protein n=1 Tax=Parvularcula lutaonensis TaxID=491923 RepID=A0ABV7MDU5_9PROT|nr:capsular polysaccharide biosynthesis protein [Parvularcula lutaonensis]GGY53964.1 capsular polysaccharide export protein [Parvularcula lutaonensis]